MFRLGIVVANAVTLGTIAASANCGTGGACEVGSAGQGSASSDGKSQGFHTLGPGRNPTTIVTNSGNLDAGRLDINRADGSRSTTSGTFRGDIVRGRGTGEFGDGTGQCPVDLCPDAC
jgi:hypothetical protein